MLEIKVVDSVSSSNGWTDEIHKPKVGIVLAVLCRL